MEGIFFALVLLVGIVRALYRFFLWVSRSVKGTSAPPPARPPVPETAATSVPKGLSLPRPAPSSPAPRPITSARPASYQRARRPEAGGPAVFREATTEEFRREEDEALTGEPRSLRSLDAAPILPASAARPFALLRSPDDLVRAFILSEVLGSPRCRRPR